MSAVWLRAIRTEADDCDIASACFFELDRLFESDLVVGRNDEFDAGLAHKAREMGIEIHENEKVMEIRRLNGHVEVQTENQVYQTRVLVGADGANSMVRRKLVAEEKSRVCRLVEAHTPNHRRRDVQPSPTVSGTWPR